MGRFIYQRVIRSLITLWIVVTAVFFVLRLSGDPAIAMLGPEASPAALEAFRERHGLNASLPVQYLTYLQNLLRGDFGESLSSGRPAWELFQARVGATLELGLTAVTIAVVIGIPAGIIAAVKRNSLWDRTTMVTAFIGESAPGFFVGIMLILVLSLYLNLLPSSGRGDLSQLVMPAITLATGLLATLARMTRSSFLEVISADYVRTARAKGLTTRRIMVVHLLRNAAMPVVTILGIWVGAMIGGAAITETVFAWPGVGRLAVEAVTQRDYPVIQLVVLVVAATVVMINLLIDLLYGVLDPRISSGASKGN